MQWRRGMHKWPSDLMRCLSYLDARQAVTDYSWAAMRENVPSDMCVRRKLKSACASAQSDQSLRRPHERTLHPWLSKMRQVKILIRLRECAVWSESSLGAPVHRYTFCRCDSITWLMSLFYIQTGPLLVRLTRLSGFPRIFKACLDTSSDAQTKSSEWNLSWRGLLSVWPISPALCNHNKVLLSYRIVNKWIYRITPKYSDILILSVIQTKTDTYANSIEPDETAHNKPFHQHIHYLPFSFSNRNPCLQKWIGTSSRKKKPLQKLRVERVYSLPYLS